MVEQCADGALQFNPRLFVRSHRRHESGFGRSQRAAGLQNRGRGRGAELIFLLLGIERLFRIFHGRFGRSYAGLILLDGELGLADFNAYPILGLLERHLGLAIFEFTADLHCLSGAVSQRNVELQANAFVGSRGVDELVQG